MFVTNFSIADQKHEIPYDKESSPRAVEKLATVAGLCNSGSFDAATANLPLDQKKIIGDATDQAILRFSESIQPVEELYRQWRKVYELGFNSKNKFMLTLVESEEERHE
jgi:sodium/potassium-transporting ATPase subunit alpha